MYALLFKCVYYYLYSLIIIISYQEASKRRVEDGRRLVAADGLGENNRWRHRGGHAAHRLEAASRPREEEEGEKEEEEGEEPSFVPLRIFIFLLPPSRGQRSGSFQLRINPVIDVDEDETKKATGTFFKYVYIFLF